MDGEHFGVVKSHLGQILHVSEHNIVLSTRIKEDLNATSLDVVELAAALGNHYSCKISDDEVEQAHTVADLLQVVERNAAKA